MAKSRTSGASGGIDVKGLSFKSIPSTESARKNNARKVAQALRNGKRVVFESSGGSFQEYTRNSDRTYSYRSSRTGKSVLSEEMGKSSIASHFVGKGGGRYAIN